MIPSIRKRYFFTVVSSLFRALLSFITGMLLARFLGPKDYGNMSFLLGTFLAVRQLLDMGTAQAFFTFMSQQLRSKQFVFYYWGWLFIQFAVTIFIIAVLLPVKWVEVIWHGEQRVLVLLAFAASFMQNSVWSSIQQCLEAQRQTYRAQGIGTLVIIIHIFAILILWKLGHIGLYVIFTAITIEYLLATLLAQRFFLYSGEHDVIKRNEKVDNIFKMFLNYCKPLVIYSWVSFLFSFFDTWLLQNYAGSVNQAYYSVSSQFASVALLATSSITNIFYKEIAEAYHKNDLKRVRIMYRKVSRSLFLIGSITSCFFIPWTKELLSILLGDSYIAGSTTLAIMFLYPIHQSMGQIANSILFATEHVVMQVKIGTTFMLVSIIASYLILAPANALIPGLQLASEGLALKMLFMQFLQVNIFSYVIARIFKWRFDWSYQFLSMAGCLLAGWTAWFIITSFMSISFSVPFQILSCAFVYIIFIVCLIYLKPRLSGFTRDELLVFANKGMNLIFLKNKY